MNAHTGRRSKRLNLGIQNFNPDEQAFQCKTKGSAREVLYSSASIPLPSMEWAVDGHRETLAWQRNGGKGISIDGDGA